MIISPLNENIASVPQIGIYKIVATTDVSAKNGSNLNINFSALSGIIVSLASSLIKSASGWNHGGPTRFCNLAYNFLSTNSTAKPNTAKNRNPGNIKI